MPERNLNCASELDQGIPEFREGKVGEFLWTIVGTLD